MSIFNINETIGKCKIVADDKDLIVFRADDVNLEITLDYDDVNHDGVVALAKLIAEKLSEIPAEKINEANNTGLVDDDESE